MFLQPSQVADTVVMGVMVLKIVDQLKLLLLVRKKDSWMNMVSMLLRLPVVEMIDPVIGRDEEIIRVIEILNRRTKNNPVLIGEPGVGKTAVVEGLAQKIVDGDVPHKLQGKEVIRLDVVSLVQGTGIRGQFEERMQKLMEEIRNVRILSSLSMKFTRLSVLVLLEMEIWMQEISLNQLLLVANSN